jgi:hypothetical protein
MEEFDVEIEIDVEHEFFKNLSDFLFPLFNVFLFFIPPIWAYISFLKSCSYLYFDMDD